MNLNIFDLPSLPLHDELVTILQENNKIRIERIISTGQTSGWYDQDEAEFVVLIEGFAKLEFENDCFLSMKKGDTILIHPHQLHRVAHTSMHPPCIWLCVFYKI